MGKQYPEVRDPATFESFKRKWYGLNSWIEMNAEISVYCRMGCQLHQEGLFPWVFCRGKKKYRCSSIRVYCGEIFAILGKKDG
jgi:hypothetical protein